MSTPTLFLVLLTVLIAKGALSSSETQQVAVRMEADTVDTGRCPLSQHFTVVALFHELESGGVIPEYVSLVVAGNEILTPWVNVKKGALIGA